MNETPNQANMPQMIQPANQPPPNQPYYQMPPKTKADQNAQRLLG